MKFYFLAALMLICTCSFAQEPVLTDNLNTDMAAIIKKHFPFGKDEMLWSNYMLDPVLFNKKIDQARTDAYRQAKPGNSKETTLKHLDADYYLRNILLNYGNLYGVD